MLMLFPRFDKLLTTKNTNATFFLVGGSIIYRIIALIKENLSTKIKINEIVQIYKFSITFRWKEGGKTGLNRLLNRDIFFLPRPTNYRSW